MTEGVLFETQRLIVRKLILTDLKAFHELQGNPNVMRFVNSKVGDFNENKLELDRLIQFYDKPGNEFQIYAVILKNTQNLIGTVALVKMDGEEEIGYRFIERLWGNGFGKEIVPALIEHCRKLGISEIVAYAAYENKASLKIIEQNDFVYEKDSFAEDIDQLERKYKLKL
ncbi:GNAT family N-acetyltransferase [Urechidicola vernalis]|uniref:GNAT family N-acetyltransferase n=1 Tax=Urechidicola vernalis TaxID=3075600 RepID=A0ABU2Y1Y1_9FLAO|nr:GNAT family N-acetyltransferase [Urechidicola sp. P050]MDT0552216.1 GNAT family N-acetyltransferase [Urechidicola sp. P050]